MNVRRWHRIALAGALVPAVVGIGDIAWSSVTVSSVTACFSNHGGPIVVPSPGKHCPTNYKRITVGAAPQAPQLPPAYTRRADYVTVPPGNLGQTGDFSNQMEITHLSLPAGNYLVSATGWAQLVATTEAHTEGGLDCFVTDNGSNEDHVYITMRGTDDRQAVALSTAASVGTAGEVDVKCATDVLSAAVQNLRVNAIPVGSVDDQTPQPGP